MGDRPFLVRPASGLRIYPRGFTDFCVVHRYKNRQNVGPNAKCVGIDMNRFVHTLVFHPVVGALNISLQELGMYDDKRWVPYSAYAVYCRGISGSRPRDFLSSRRAKRLKLVQTHARTGTLDIAPLKHPK